MSRYISNNTRKKYLTKGRIEKMLAYFEQAAERYLELLENADDNDARLMTYNMQTAVDAKNHIIVAVDTTKIKRFRTA